MKREDLYPLGAIVVGGVVCPVLATEDSATNCHVELPPKPPVERFHCPICGRFVPKAFWVAVPEGATFVIGGHPFVGPCRIYSCNDCTSKTVKLADSQEVIVSMNWVEWN